MKQTIKLTEDKIRTIVKETITNVITEAANHRELMNQVAKEVLGTDTFEEFYRNMGLMVGARDYYLLSQYFKRLAEIEKQQEQNNPS